MPAFNQVKLGIWDGNQLDLFNGAPHYPVISISLYTTHNVSNVEVTI